MTAGGLLLAVDVGNTNVVAGLYPAGDGAIAGRIRLPTSRGRDAGEWADLLRQELDMLGIEPAAIGGVVTGSVVPSLDPLLAAASERLFGLRPLVVDPGTQRFLPMTVDEPAAVGADRVVNAFAARQRWGSPVVVADFGTATTFDVVSPAGEFAGGVIAPGLGISAEALFERAAKLPRVEVVRPARVVGRNTVEAMQSGIWWGAVSFIEGMLRRLSAEIGVRPKTVATGGLSALLAGEGLFDSVEPDLTLDGLRLIHRLTSPAPR